MKRLEIAWKVAQKVGPKPTKDYIRRHCRAIIPPPAELEKRVREVINCFRTSFDRETSSYLYSDEMEKVVDLQMKHVLRGCLSDPVDSDGNIKYQVRGYVALEHSKDPRCRVPVYSTVRGSSQLEGFHMHQNKNITGTVVSMDLYDAQMFPAICLWNLGRDRGLLHLRIPDAFNPKLLYDLNVIHKEIHGTTKYHLNFNFNGTNERFGGDYLTQQRKNGTGAADSPSPVTAKKSQQSVITSKITAPPPTGTRSRKPWSNSTDQSIFQPVSTSAALPVTTLSETGISSKITAPPPTGTCSGKPRPSASDQSIFQPVSSITIPLTVSSSVFASPLSAVPICTPTTIIQHTALPTLSSSDLGTASCSSIQYTILPRNFSCGITVSTSSSSISSISTPTPTSSSTLAAAISKNVKNRRHRSNFRAGKLRSVKIDQFTESTRKELANCFAEVRRKNVKETQIFEAVLAQYTLKWHDHENYPDLDFLNLSNIRDYWRHTVDQRKRTAANPDLTSLHRALRQTQVISSTTPIKVQPKLQTIKPKPKALPTSTILTPLTSGEESNFSTIAFPPHVVSTSLPSSLKSPSSSEYAVFGATQPFSYSLAQIPHAQPILPQTPLMQKQFQPPQASLSAASASSSSNPVKKQKARKCKTCGDFIAGGIHVVHKAKGEPSFRYCPQAIWQLYGTPLNQTLSEFRMTQYFQQHLEKLRKEKDSDA